MNRPMEHAAVGLEKIVTNALRRVPGKEAPLLAWPLACGRIVGERTRAMDFSDGILRVEVPDASWRAELKALAPQYVAVINRYVSESVERIEFVLAGRVPGEGARATRA